MFTNQNERLGQWKSEYYQNWWGDSQSDWSWTNEIKSADSNLSTSVKSEEVARQIKVATDPKQLERLCDLMRKLLQALQDVMKRPVVWYTARRKPQP